MNVLNKKITPALLAILILFGLKTDLKAQRLYISGIASYARVNNFVTLGADRIDHFLNSSYYESGSLYLQLWTCLTPYNGLQTSLGYKVAEVTLDPLLAGYYYSNVSETVPFFAPPNGNYYMVMVLAESNGYERFTMDWYNFPNTETFGYIPPPVVTLPPPVVTLPTLVVIPLSITSDLSTVSVPKGIPIPLFTITTNFGANSFAAKGLPKGLKLNKKNGVISGKPTKPGTYTVTLTAKKMKGKKVEQQAAATKVVIVY